MTSCSSYVNPFLNEDGIELNYSGIYHSDDGGCERTNEVLKEGNVPQDTSTETETNIFLKKNLYSRSDFENFSYECEIEDSPSKNVFFVVKPAKPPKPGRRKKLEVEKECTESQLIRSIHNKDSKDNQLRKIKVYYQQFLISFFNQCIKFEITRETNNFIKKENLKSYQLKKVPSDITSDIAIEFNQVLFKQTIGEFFSRGVSKKYKNDQGFNKKLVEYLKGNFSGLKALFNISYMEGYNSLFLNADESKLPKEEYSRFLNNSLHLKGFLEKLERKENQNYINNLKKLGEKEFLDYFLNTGKKRKERNPVKHKN